MGIVTSHPDSAFDQLRKLLRMSNKEKMPVKRKAKKYLSGSPSDDRIFIVALNDINIFSCQTGTEAESWIGVTEGILSRQRKIAEENRIKTPPQKNTEPTSQLVMEERYIPK